MGLFDEMLGSDESLFKNEEALNPDFVPKVLPYRGMQQQQIANAIKPLMMGRNGRNMFIYGAPGIGKTAATKWVFRDLEDNTDDVYTIYVNCWQKNTTYKVFMEVCDQLGYKFTQNKNTEELFKIIAGIVNKKAAVFAFDEIDKAEDFDFLYSILGDIYKRSVLLITNYKEWITKIEDRIKSRLLPEVLEFKPYSTTETTEILKQRSDYAFIPHVWDDKAFELVTTKAGALKDIRTGLYLLRESGLSAEEASSKKILPEHAEQAVQKLDDFSIKKSTDLEEDTRLALTIVKESSGSKIGDLYKLYKEKGGAGTYKTFQRKVAKLDKAGLVSTTKTAGGKEGNTTLVSVPKKLTDY